MYKTEKIVKHLIIFIFSFFFGVVQISSQDIWTLNKCIKYANKNNILHQNYNLNVKSERLESLQSKLNLLPSISASSSGGMRYGRSVDNSTNTYTETEYFGASGSIGSNLNLFQGFSKINRIAYSKFRLKVAEWSELNYEDDLAFEVLNSYYDIVFYTGLVQIAKDQLKISNYNLKKTQAQVEIGIQAKSDLLQIQATLEQEKLDIIMTQNKVEEKKYRLWELMNYKINSSSGFEIDYNISLSIFIPILALNSVYSAFSNISPTLKKEEANVQAAIKNTAITRAYYYPSINLNASIGSGYNQTDKTQTGEVTAFKNQFDKNLNKYIGASISIPIFNKNQQRTRVNQAKINQEKAQNALAEQKKSVYFKIANDIRELNALQIKYTQTQKKLHADEMAYKVALKKYSEGLINIIELLTTKEQVSNAKSQLLLAKIQYQIKSKTVEFYKGNRFWE